MSKDPGLMRSGNGAALSKTAIVLIVVVTVIVFGTIGFMWYRSRKRKREAEELAAQMQTLQAQANDPNTPIEQRQSLLGAIAGIAQRINQLRGGNSEPGSVVVEAYWPGGGTGMCMGSGILNKDRVLKKGINAMEVCQLQTLMNKKGAKLPVDGKFSTQTETALKSLAGNRSSITLRQIPKTYWA